MKKYLTSLIVCFLVVGLIPQLVNAGDQNNPEITDPEKDVLLFGQFALPFVNRFLKHMDILSAWFSEKSDEPNVVYLTLKLQEVKKTRLMGIYGVAWHHEGLEYAVVLIFSHGKENASGIQIEGTNYIHMQDFYTIDDEKNTITWAVPKEAVGNLTVGDTIDSPIAVAGLRFCSNALANLTKKRFGTNCIGFDITEEGKDYVLLY